MGKTIILQIVNLIFGFLPLTRWYRFKARLLRFAGMNCNPSARIISSAKIVALNVSIGEDTFIGHQVLISGNDQYKIQIGNNVDLAPRVCIISGSHEIDMVGEHSAGRGTGGNVIIEDGAWIGANSIILPGVIIGKKAIIGAGSVVNKNIPPYCIALGNPCKPVKLWNAELGVFEPII